MAKNLTLDVAIISRFRPGLLSQCLAFIEKQTFNPQRIILIISSKDKPSQEVARKSVLPIKIKFQDKKGHAYSRNKALLSCHADFLYFIDDDCQLEKNTLKEAFLFLKNHPEYSAVQGKSINIDNGFYSQFAQWTNDLWLKRLWEQKTKTFKALDTKNACFRRKIIKNLRFNECLGSEDVDFGLQISSQGGKIGLNPKMIVKHNEQAFGFWSYLKKRTRMVKGLNLIKKKWGNLSYFYENNRDYEKEIKKAFLKSKYNKQLRYRLFLESAFFLRRIRKSIDKVAFQRKNRL